MAHIHVLDNAGGDNFNALVHIAVPAGNNSVGVSWKTCWLASLGAAAPASKLLVGNGPGQISQAESNQISGGDLMEFDFQFTDDPNSTQATRDANIDAVALSVQTQRLADLRSRFKFYGYTRA
jgi:hypothetical protein